MIQLAEHNGRKSLELRSAALVHCGEAQTGRSQVTGNEWKVRTVTLKIMLGTNSEGQEETMTIAAKCLNEMADRIAMVALNQHIHCFIRLGVNARFKIAQTECTLVDFTL